jgi:ABC-type transporter Mla maintaining outer membrane lipid asymmetry permease subunit MlaE
MRISEEIDALEVIAIKSVAYLSSTRALADGPKTGLKAVD